MSKAQYEFVQIKDSSLIEKIKNRNDITKAYEKFNTHLKEEGEEGIDKNAFKNLLTELNITNPDDMDLQIIRKKMKSKTNEWLYNNEYYNEYPNLFNKDIEKEYKKNAKSFKLSFKEMIKKFDLLIKNIVNSYRELGGELEPGNSINKVKFIPVADNKNRIIYSFVEDGAKTDFINIFGEEIANKFDKICQNPNVPNEFKDKQFWIKRYNITKKENQINVEDFVEGNAELGLKEATDLKKYVNFDAMFSSDVILPEDISKILKEFIKQFESLKESTSQEYKEILNSPRANDVEIVAKNNAWTVYKINTPEASVKYGLFVGGKAKWCLSGAYYESNNIEDTLLKEVERYYNSYLRNENDKLYFVINTDGSTNNKYAIIDYGNSLRFWDKDDERIKYLPLSAPAIPGWEDVWIQYARLDKSELEYFAKQIIEDYKKENKECITEDYVGTKLKEYGIPVNYNVILDVIFTMEDDFDQNVYDDLEGYYRSNEYKEKNPEGYYKKAEERKRQKEREKEKNWENLSAYDIAILKFRPYNIPEEKNTKIKDIIINISNKYLENSDSKLLVNWFKKILSEYEMINSKSIIEGMDETKLKEYIKQNITKSNNTNFEDIKISVEDNIMSFNEFKNRYNNALMILIVNDRDNYLRTGIIELWPLMTKKELVENFEIHSLSDYRKLLEILPENEKNKLIETVTQEINKIK